MSDRASKSFERALDRAGASLVETNARADAPSASKPRLRASLDLRLAEGGGGEARWKLAMIWADEPVEKPAPACAATSEPSRTEAELEAAIAEEIGVASARSRRELARRWRDFIWRNHPDRQPPHERRNANARVAIANALYEAARRKLKAS